MKFRQAYYDEPLLFEMASEEAEPIDLEGLVPEGLRRDRLNLPNVPEHEVVRHYTRLSQMNFAIDTGFYPLGSCTMKYNPRVNERLASLRGFRDLHPLQEEAAVQGAAELMRRREEEHAATTGARSG